MDGGHYGADVARRTKRLWTDEEKRSICFQTTALGDAAGSGLTRRQVTSDPGVGLSTLGKWIRAISDEAKVPDRDADLLRENERLRNESRILREEREVLKKAAQFFAAQKP